MNKMKLIAVMGALSLFSTAGVFANENEGACRDDAKRLCADVKPGDGAIHDCMKSHEKDLSQGCKDKMANKMKHFEEKKQEIEVACQADIKQYCANVTPGEGREFACLKSYGDKISAGCKEKLPHRKMMGKHRGEHKDK